MRSVQKEYFALAAVVSNAGGLGSLGIGATNAEGARKMIAEFRALSARSLNVNVFCHRPAKLDAKIESAWIDRLRPEFARFDATPPTQLTEIYRSFVEDDDMLATLIQEKPKVVSFHFGVPAPERVRALPCQPFYCFSRGSVRWRDSRLSGGL